MDTGTEEWKPSHVNPAFPSAPTMKYLPKLLKKDLSEIMVATMAIPALP